MKTREADVTSAVYGYMTSVKEVIKRDGTHAVFSSEKLERSIIQSLFAAGFKEKDLPRYVSRITGNILSRIPVSYTHLTLPTIYSV